MIACNGALAMLPIARPGMVLPTDTGRPRQFSTALRLATAQLENQNSSFNAN